MTGRFYTYLHDGRAQHLAQRWVDEYLVVRQQAVVLRPVKLRRQLVLLREVDDFIGVRTLAVDVDIEAFPGALLDVAHVLEEQVQAFRPSQFAHKICTFFEPVGGRAVADVEVLDTHPVDV